jgi:hypothetical protein
MGEVRALIEHSFVHEGADYLRRRRERDSLVNISAVTGIARQAVQQLLSTESDAVAPRSDTQVHRAVRVLRGWHEDPEYVTPAGVPRDLPLYGKPPSFVGLVKRYGGGVTHQSILERLIADGAVQASAALTGGQRLKAVRPDLQPEMGSTESLELLSQILGDAIDGAIVSNEREYARLDPRTVAVTVPATSAHVVRARLERRGDVVIQSLENALHDMALTPDQIVEASAGDGSLDVRVTVLMTLRPRPAATDSSIGNAPVRAKRRRAGAPARPPRGTR